MSARYFVIEEGPLGTFPATYEDELPLNHTNRIVYALRLDTLPAARRWMEMTLIELQQVYIARLAAGTLPPSNVGKPDATR